MQRIGFCGLLPFPWASGSFYYPDLIIFSHSRIKAPAKLVHYFCTDIPCVSQIHFPVFEVVHLKKCLFDHACHLVYNDLFLFIGYGLEQGRNYGSEDALHSVFYFKAVLQLQPV